MEEIKPINIDDVLRKIRSIGEPEKPNATEGPRSLSDALKPLEVMPPMCW